MKNWTRAELLVKVEKMQKKIEELEEEKRLLIAKEYFQVQHNERNAGRKTKITSDLIKQVKEHKKNGFSFDAIAKELNISVGLAHKAYHL